MQFLDMITTVRTRPARIRPWVSETWNFSIFQLFGSLYRARYVCVIVLHELWASLSMQVHCLLSITCWQLACVNATLIPQRNLLQNCHINSNTMLSSGVSSHIQLPVIMCIVNKHRGIKITHMHTQKGLSAVSKILHQLLLTKPGALVLHCT